MSAVDWAGHIPADPWLETAGAPSCDEVLNTVTCPTCKGSGAVRHGSGNPELVEDCTLCGGDGTYTIGQPDGGEAA